MIDLSTEFGKRVQARLSDERIIWLTTVSGSSMPQPRPVWFLWDGETFLIYSRQDTFKEKHIKANPKVALNFDGNGMGGDIVIFTGRAQIAEDAPPADEIPEYVQKYQDGFLRLGMSKEEFASTYSLPIRVTPEKLRGH
jgi:PPOX class probable F420-dependent enzyme